MKVLFDILRMTLVILAHMITLYLLSEPKSKFNHPLFLWIPLFLVSEMISVIMILLFGVNFSTTFILGLILLITYAVFFCLINSGSLSRNLFFFMSYSLYFMLAVSISQYISILLFSSNELATLLIRTTLSLTFIIILIVKLRKLFLNLSHEISRGWTELALFAAVACLSAFTYALSAFFFIKNEVIYLAILSMVTILVTSAYLIIFKLIILLKDERNKERQEYRQRLLATELETERNYVKKAMQYRHDLRHHSRMLNEYLEEGDLDGAKRYLREYENLIKDDGFTTFCENRVINAELRIASRLARDAGVEFVSNVTVAEDIAINDIDLVILLGNLLENAINAAKSGDNPYTEVNARTNSNTFILEVRNTFNGKGDIKWGTGLESVFTIIRKNFGLFRQEEEENFFISRLILPLF